MKSVLFGNEAKAKLLEGVNLVAKPVASTLGPKGRNAVLSRQTAPPIVTNDGVSIASWINEVSDPFVNVGVQMIKEVATKQNEPGDGTTTATVLAAALVNESVKQVLAGNDPLEIRDGILHASRIVIEQLKASAQQVETEKQLVQVATVSVEDQETGKLIGELMHKVGKDGAITVETSKDVKLESDITQGIKFDRGYLTPYFMTNPFRQESVIEDTPILVTNHTIADNEQIVPLVDALIAKGIKGMVIVCDHMKGEALNTIVTNHLKGIFSFLVVTLPGLDDARIYAGQDIAIACGARFLDASIDKLEELTLDDLGSAKRVIGKQEYTVIVEGAGTTQAIADRVKVLKEETKQAVSDFDRDQLKERIARLSGGIGVVRIGAATEQELTYKKHKIEDALAATRAAVEEGIVPGGGVALLRLCDPITTFSNMGEQIFNKALVAPFRQIVENAGGNPETIAEKILLEENNGWGWDAKRGEYLNMVAHGIIDPVKVTRKAIENAASMAATFITAESLIVDVPEDQESREDRFQRTKGR